MKKTYRLKRDVSESLRKLFNGRAVEKAEEEWNSRPHEESGLGFEKLCINLVRIQCEYGDCVTFTSHDFEEIVEYDPDGWNRYPDCTPSDKDHYDFFITVGTRGIRKPEIFRWNACDGYFMVFDGKEFRRRKGSNCYFKKITFPERG